MLSQLLPIFAITFTVFVLFFLFMGVGYMVKKEPLKGSCGGVATLMGDEYCQFCGNDPNKCDSLTEEDKQKMRDEQQTQSKKAAELGKSAV
ncbi:(Na+)-NQR maturation NqrM [Psychrobacter sp. HD31]|uniref:(Na+)-NQR maturation NqrM n=1 Tax=Psychrobacter sp. HD31 TaxID=3112003 RepID=UPI003DA4068E